MKNNTQDLKNKIVDLETKLNEIQALGEKLNYSEEEVDRLDEELSSIQKKIDQLLVEKKELKEKRDKIKQHYEDMKKLISSIDEEKKDLESKSSDITKEEFYEQLRQIFNTSLTAKNGSIEEELHNKLIMLIIERIILQSLYAEKNKEFRQILKTPNIVEYEEVNTSEQQLNKNKFSLFKKQSKPERKRISKKEDKMNEIFSNLAYARYNEIGVIIACLCNVPSHTYDNGIDYIFDDLIIYSDIIEKLKNRPEDFASAILDVGTYQILDVETSQKLYDELLIPYYKQMGFPVKEDENHILKPYAPVLGLLNGDTNQFSFSEHIESKVKGLYEKDGTSASIFLDYIHRSPQWVKEQVFLSPKEMILFHNYNFLEKNKDLLQEYIEGRNQYQKWERESSAENRETSHARR